jgi:hypothetical protein
MTTYTLTLTYFALAATLGRGLITAAKLVPPTCDRCGVPHESQSLGRPDGCDQPRY